MKAIINFQRTIAICLMFLLCYPTQAANDYTEAKMDSLAMKFYRWEKGNENDSIRSLQVRESEILRAFLSYTHNHEYTILQDDNFSTYIDKILIIVKENVYSAIPLYVLRYAHDIHNAYGCSVVIESVNDETAQQIRALIQTYSTGLNGAVLIGDIAHTYFYHPDYIFEHDTLWTHETFPCDLFYMDLNGSWTLKSGEINTYDRHTGNVKPEIFVGRINASTMGRDEIQELRDYFDKNHSYWTGKKALNKQRALTFTGPDWENSSEHFKSSVAPLYGNNKFDSVYGSFFTSANYCTYIQNSNYEFIQLACHSHSQGHYFDSTITYPDLYITSLTSYSTKSIGYNLFCCHACDWTDSRWIQCLGEGYLYGSNNNSSALTVLGSTKTGGMLGFSYFYNPLGDGKCIGQAFKEWWINQWGNNHNNDAIHWAYGMVILGDPLINFNFTNDCDNILYLNSGEETTNNMYYAQSEIVVQNYSLIQSQSVTLSAPSIQITGPFTCGLGSSFIATPYDSCVCNTSREYSNDTLIEMRARQRNVSNLIYSIYPNPVSDVLMIDANEPLTLISIYNQSGQCVLQTNDSQINVSHLPAGIYVFRALTINGIFIQAKIIHK